MIPEWYISIFITLLIKGFNQISILFLFMNLLFLNGITGGIVEFSWYIGELCILYLFTLIIYKLNIIRTLKSSIVCWCIIYFICLLINKLWGFSDSTRNILLYIPIYLLGIVMYYLLQNAKELDCFYIKG